MALIFPNGSRTVNTPPKAPTANTNAPGYAAGAPQKPAIDMSSFAPGRAQPRPPQSQGTPFQAYSPQQTTSYSTNQDGVARTYTDNVFQGSAGNYGNSPAGSRPPAFTESAVGVNGQQFSAPSQAFTQRDALIDRINAAKTPMFAGAGTYLGEGAPPPTWGQKPPLGFNTLMGQANDMVAGGWQNPFAGAPLPPQGIDVSAGSPPPPALRDGGRTHHRWSLNNPGHPLATPEKLPQFGGSAYALSPPPGELGGLEAGMMHQPYVNQSGQQFTGSMSFAPGTPQEYQNQVYGAFANRNGYFQQPAAQPPAQPLAPPSQMGGIRHWTDNPAYQQPQFQEPSIPQVAGTTDFFTGRSAPPVSGPAMQPPEGASQLGTYVSPRFRMPSIPGRKMPSQGRRVQA